MIRSGRPPAHRPPRARWRSPLFPLMALLVALTGLSLMPSAAQAAPVYQITGSWEAGTPTTVRSGAVVTGVWRVNVNDDQPAPANDPVDNVTFTVAATNGTFDSVPGACRTTGVTPVSTVSADGKTLTCNVGTLTEGTAAVVQAPMIADGATGSQLTAVGSIDGQTAALDPIDIVNPFGMDMRWAVGTPDYTSDAGYFGVDMQWTLSKLDGSDPGTSTLTYQLNIGSNVGAVTVDPKGCTAFTADTADGHPWSGGSHPADQTTAFPGCTLVQDGPTSFTLTLTGIDYDPASAPTRDSAGAKLPSDRVALASGSIWLRVTTTQAGSIDLTQAPVTYTSSDGTQTASDDPSNNTESKAWTLPGSYSSGWGRGVTASGGTTWDNTYKVAAGTLVGQYIDTALGLNTARADNLPVGMCSALDTKYVTFDHFQWSTPPGGVPGATLEYYTGNDSHLDPASASYDPNTFDCAADPGGWSSTMPGDPTQVKAVRVTMTQGEAETYNVTGHDGVAIYQRIKPDVPVGTDVWSFMTGQYDDGAWYGGSGCILAIPGGRYPCTTGFADVLHIVDALPSITKSADRSVVTPGDPATFTLLYAANGAGAIPSIVNDYTIVDTLPVHMTYVPGSASPEPVVTTDGSGRQVLTWTLDGVSTNTGNILTYQAVTDSSASPGQVETNSVTASYNGATASAAAQVTVATDGYTQISKTADTPFVPNADGQGDGAGSWTVSVRSFDPLPQAFTDTIDILPFIGDGRGTQFQGSYELSGVDALAGQTVYYTDADPATLSDDPNASANGAANAPSGLWSTTMPAHPTAVRVLGPALAPGAEQQFRVNVTTHGADGGDAYVNRAQGVAGHTELVMRTSAPMSVANYYSAALKKYVQGRDGKWHDANDVADYPVFRYGDVIKYRIVVTNTGQGTLHHVVVADDKQPALGGFTIDSLEPGKSASHEYSIRLDKSVAGTVVNTATATADTPPDSQVPPTINSDPAGFEVANYATTKSANPASGTVLVPGQRVTYTLKVAQQGSVPAVASFSDDLAKVLDDATYNGDAKASIGTVSYRAGHLIWSGTIPVGQVATVTYSVTVKATKHLGDRGLVNTVTSDGCATACSTNHHVAAFDLKITKKVIGSKQVAAGHKVRYGLKVVNRGPDAAPGPIRVGDKLPKGLKLRNAHGSGWSCVVAKSTRKVSCVRATSLAVGAKAPVITVVAKATKAAIGRRLVNTATVNAAGDTVKHNNHSKAVIRVIKKAPMWVPSNSYRLVPRERWLV